MTTALAKRQLTPDIWQMIQSIAPTMKDARLFGVATPEQAAAIMLKGHELGLSFTASFEFIHVIEGRPSLSPRGALALILQSPECAGVEIEDISEGGKPSACKVTMKRKNGLIYTATFSMEDATRAGLVKKDSGWDKYPALMMKWRAIGFAADVVFPDVIGGMKRADELGADLTPTGEVIEGSWTPASAIVSGPQQTATPTQITIADLTSQYSPAQIMEANEGRIPATKEELELVAERLRGV